MDDFKAEIEERRQEDHEWNASIKLVVEKQRETELSYARERKEWEQEKRGLKERIADLEIEAKMADDRNFARPEALISQQVAKWDKDKARAQAAEDARGGAEEATRKSDRESLVQLEKLIVVQKEKQLRHEAVVEAQGAAENKHVDDQAAKFVAEKSVEGAADDWAFIQGINRGEQKRRHQTAKLVAKKPIRVEVNDRASTRGIYSEVQEPRSIRKWVKKILQP
jgi:hypothetical protein